MSNLEDLRALADSARRLSQKEYLENNKQDAHSTLIVQALFTTCIAICERLERIEDAIAETTK